MKIPGQLYNYRNKVESKNDAKSAMLRHLSSNESMITNVGKLPDISFHKQLKFVQDSLYKPKLTVGALGINDFTPIHSPFENLDDADEKLYSLEKNFNDFVFNSAPAYNKDFYISTAMLLTLYQNQNRLNEKLLSLMQEHNIQIYKEND